MGVILTTETNWDDPPSNHKNLSPRNSPVLRSGLMKTHWFPFIRPGMKPLSSKLPAPKKKRTAEFHLQHLFRSSRASNSLNSTAEFLPLGFGVTNWEHKTYRTIGSMYGIYIYMYLLLAKIYGKCIGKYSESHGFLNGECEKYKVQKKLWDDVRTPFC